MIVIASSTPEKRYGVLVFDVIGEPTQDRQHCAGTIDEGVEVALNDMKEFPLSCACVYKVVNGVAVPVRNISCAGNVSKP